MGHLVGGSKGSVMLGISNSASRTPIYGEEVRGFQGIFLPGQEIQRGSKGDGSTQNLQDQGFGMEGVGWGIGGSNTMN